MPVLGEASLPRTDIDFQELARALHPLGNATRLKLLHLLTIPRHLEEIASSLKMSRQGARKHLDELVELGVIKKQQGRRDFGPVTDYVLNLQRLFQLHSEFGKLGTLRPARASEEVLQTLAQTGHAPARPGSGDPCLTLVRGLDEGRVFQLADQPGRVWRIGRNKESEIRLDYDPFLSNRQAEIRRDPKEFQLVDAFSSNGTYLNWRRLEKGAAVPLQRGDIVGVGKSLLVFQFRG